MKTIIVILLLLVFSGFTLPVAAVELSYSFISANYGSFVSKVDGVSEPLDGEGYTVDLSYAVRPHAAITAAYNISVTEANIAGDAVKADIDATRLGILIHFPINDTSDLIIEAGFINGKADVSVNGIPDKRVDADGGVVALGFRAMAYGDVEIAASLRKNSIEESSSVSIDLSVGYYVYESVSLDAGYLLDSKDGSNLLTFGITKYF